VRLVAAAKPPLSYKPSARASVKTPTFYKNSEVKWMKNLQEIREELKLVREYNFALQSAEKGAEVVIPSEIKALLERYVVAVKGAPKPVQRAYSGLYERGMTQSSLASEWGVTEKYVQILNKRLLLYLQSYGQGT